MLWYWSLLILCLAAPRLRAYDGRFALALSSWRPSFFAMRASATATELFEQSWSRAGISTSANSVSHQVFPSLCDGELKGLGALRGFDKEGVEVIKLPRPCVLAVSSSDASPVTGISEAVWQKLKLTTRLSVLLLLQWSLKEQSPLFAYLQQLPEPGLEGFSTPFHWSSQAISRLASAYPSLANSVLKQRKDYATLYASLEGVLSIRGVSYERFVWALEAVRSRAFTGLGGMDESPQKSFLPAGLFAAAAMTAAVGIANTNGGGELAPAILATAATLSLVPFVLNAKKESCVLLPAIDSANHASTKFNCKIAFEPAADAFLLRSTGLIPPGAELLISYGDRDNDDLLQYFGFVEADNAQDRYVLDVERTGTLSPIVVNRRDRSTWTIPDDVKAQDIKPLLQKELQAVVDEMDRHRNRDGENAAKEAGEGADESQKRVDCLLTSFLQSKRETLQCALHLLEGV